MSQCGEIYNRLSRGKSITPYQAYYMYGCLALHSRISELRERGIKIDCHIIKFNGKRVGQYWLRS